MKGGDYGKDNRNTGIKRALSATGEVAGGGRRREGVLSEVNGDF